MVQKFTETDFNRANRLQRELDQLSERVVRLADPLDLDWDGTPQNAQEIIEAYVVWLEQRKEARDTTIRSAQAHGWDRAIAHVKNVFVNAESRAGLMTKHLFKPLIERIDIIQNPYKEK